MNMEIYTQKESRINGHGVWLYLVDTPIANIFIVEYEELDKCLEHKLFDGDLERAEKEYNRVCNALLKGKYKANGTV